MTSISIVTVSMNRTGHLIETIQHNTLIPHHIEHIIVDWSSEKPISMHELPSDTRIRLIRVDKEPDWRLGRAYNFGFGIANGTIICKLDADQILSNDFFLRNPLQDKQFRSIDPVLAGHIQRSQSGIFIANTSDLLAVGGCNEYLSGWGNEDFELYARLRFRCEHKLLDLAGCTSIEHPDNLRTPSISTTWYSKIQSSKQYTNKRNQWIASIAPWGSDSPASVYRKTHGGSYVCTDQPTLPLTIRDRNSRFINRQTLECFFHVSLTDFNDREISQLFRLLDLSIVRIFLCLSSALVALGNKILFKQLKVLLKAQKFLRTLVMFG